MKTSTGTFCFPLSHLHSFSIERLEKATELRLHFPTHAVSIQSQGHDQQWVECVLDNTIKEITAPARSDAVPRPDPKTSEPPEPANPDPAYSKVVCIEKVSIRRNSDYAH